jgi:hypothetical protein
LKSKLALFTAFATVGALVFAAVPASAGAPPVNGTGKVGTCATTGQIAIKPALVTGGTATSSATKIKTKPPKGAVGPCPGATGDGLDVVSAQSSGVSTGTGNDCGTLLGSQPSNLVLTVKWKMSKTAVNKKIAPSTITIATQTGGVSVTPPAHGQFDVTGSVTAGSFSGDAVSATVITDQDLTEIGAACGGKGLKKITFGLKASKDDAQLGSGSTTIG